MRYSHGQSQARPTVFSPRDRRFYTMKDMKSMKIQSQMPVFFRLPFVSFMHFMVKSSQQKEPALFRP